MNKKNIIKFSHNFRKLENSIFTTIRRYDKYRIGETYTIKSPKKTFKALISNKKRIKLENLSTSFLTDDTEEPTREKAIELLNSFYKKKIEDDELLTIVFFSKIDKKVNLNDF